MIRGARFVDWQEPEPFAEVERRMVELKRARNEPADNCEGQDDSDDLGWTDEDEEAGYCTVEHPCPQRSMLGPGECVHTA